MRVLLRSVPHYLVWSLYLAWSRGNRVTLAGKLCLERIGGSLVAVQTNNSHTGISVEQAAELCAAETQRKRHREQEYSYS